MSVVQDLQKLIKLFHKEHMDKLKTTSPSMNTTTLMSRSTKPLVIKQKHRQLAKASSTDKYAKKTEPLSYRFFVDFCLFSKAKEFAFHIYPIFNLFFGFSD